MTEDRQDGAMPATQCRVPEEAKPRPRNCNQNGIERFPEREDPHVSKGSRVEQSR